MLPLLNKNSEYHIYYFWEGEQIGSWILNTQWTQVCFTFLLPPKLDEIVDCEVVPGCLHLPSACGLLVKINLSVWTHSHLLSSGFVILSPHPHPPAQHCNVVTTAASKIENVSPFLSSSLTLYWRSIFYRYSRIFDNFISFTGLMHFFIIFHLVFHHFEAPIKSSISKKENYAPLFLAHCASSLALKEALCCSTEVIIL